MRYLIKYSAVLIIAIFAASFANNKPEETIQNLQKAYQAEANAAYRYQLYAVAASKEGYEQVAKLFRAVSESETIHMKNHKEALEELGANPEKIRYKKVEVGSTEENLRGPIEGEKNETESLYPEFIKTAKAEHAKPAVRSFTYAKRAESEHEKLFKKALKNLGENEPADYYVSNVTGEVIEESPSASAPQPSLENESYIEFS